MDLVHFTLRYQKKGNLNKLRPFYILLRLVYSTIISGGITSHFSLARSLNSFVLPIHEVDVSLAPLLGRQCALLVKIPADYRLSFSRCNLKCLEKLLFIFNTRILLLLLPEVRLAETHPLPVLNNSFGKLLRPTTL